MKNRCCVILYNSFLDPLVQNLMLKYVLTLSENTQWTFDLVTFEQEQYHIKESDRIALIERLKRQRIYWHPYTYHSGRFLVLKKLYDFISLFWLLFSLRLKGVTVLFSFANIAASISWPYSKILRFKTIIYSYEPHSDFMSELGDWKKNSFKYKLLNYMEIQCGKNADYLLTGTSHMVNLLKSVKTKGKVFRAPTSVDENLFQFQNEGRNWVIKKHDFNETDKIIVYVGKFGGLYYKQEIFSLVKTIKDYVNQTIHFIVITPDPFDKVSNLCKATDLDFNSVIYFQSLPPELIRIYLSAANLGISGIPPSPSQKFRSPTKIGEYLLCGLPYITCKGISEDDDIAIRENVGVVVRDLKENSIKEQMWQIEKYLRAPKEEIVTRCREIGLQYRAKKNVDKILLEIFADLSR